MPNQKPPTSDSQKPLNLALIVGAVLFGLLAAAMLLNHLLSQPP
jgi:hypothetical protein